MDIGKMSILQIFIGYYIFVTICLILHYIYNKYFYILDEKDYIKELNEISYDNKESAKNDYDKIQNDINIYVNQNLSVSEYMEHRRFRTKYRGRSIFGGHSYTRGYQTYDEWKNEVKNKRRTGYINKLSKNNQKLIQLFTRSNYTYNDYANKRNIYAAIGYIVLPMCLIPTSNNSPPLIFLLFSLFPLGIY